MKVNSEVSNLTLTTFFNPCHVCCASYTLHCTSLHFTSLHFTSLHFTSLHFTSFHFTPLSLSTNPACPSPTERCVPFWLTMNHLDTKQNTVSTVLTAAVYILNIFSQTRTQSLQIDAAPFSNCLHCTDTSSYKLTWLHSALKSLSFMSRQAFIIHMNHTGFAAQC
jgi:hypothetical protein